MKVAADKKKVFLGVEFRIDRPKGFVKTWDLPDGGKKTYTYPVDYGYFPGLKGEDDEGLDAFVGDAPDGHFESFQKLKLNGRGPGFVHELDETKFLLGLTDAERRAVYALYEKGQVHDRKVYRNMAEAVAEAERIGGAAAKTALYRVKAASRANPFGLVSAGGLLQDADDEHEALLRFKAAFLDFQKPVYVPYPVYVQVPVGAPGGGAAKPAGGSGAPTAPGAPHKHRRHYHRHKHAAENFLGRWAQHAALNAGLAARDARYLFDYPGAAGALESARKRVPRLVDDVVYGALPPQWTHDDDLSDLDQGSLTDRFLWGFQPWKYPDPAAAKTAASALAARLFR